MQNLKREIMKVRHCFIDTLKLSYLIKVEGFIEVYCKLTTYVSQKSKRWKPLDIWQIDSSRVEIFILLWSLQYHQRRAIFLRGWAHTVCCCWVHAVFLFLVVLYSTVRGVFVIFPSTTFHSRFAVFIFLFPPSSSSQSSVLHRLHFFISKHTLLLLPQLSAI